MYPLTRLLCHSIRAGEQMPRRLSRKKALTDPLLSPV